MSFNENLNKLKEALKSRITADTPKEEVDKIVELDKLADAMSADYTAQNTKLSSLQADYIEVVKNSAFMPQGTADEDPANDDGDGAEFDDIVAKIIENRK